MIVRLYLRLYTIWQRTLLFGDVTFKGFWLGILDRDGLHAIDDALYEQRMNYQSIEHNTRGLFDWEQGAVSAYFAQCRRIAVIGAGGGREVIALASMGYDVHGFECNKTLVESANRILVDKSQGEISYTHSPVLTTSTSATNPVPTDTPLHHGGQATVSWLDRDRIPVLDQEPFDGMIIGWSAFMLISGRKNRERFLTALRPVVTPDAPILLSFFTRADRDLRLQRIARIASLIRRSLGRPPAEIGDDMAPNYVHHFTRGEIEEELHAAGLQLITFCPQGTGPYDSGYAVARAPRA